MIYNYFTQTERRKMTTYTISTITKKVGIIGTQQKEVEQRVVLKDGEFYSNVPAGATDEEVMNYIKVIVEAPDATQEELDQYE